MRTFLALASVVILAAVLLAAGCQSGPGNGSLFGSTASMTPSLPANATFNGSLVPPPATGSFVPQPQFAGTGFGSGLTSPGGFGAPSAVAANPAVAANGSTQSPFWQKYQPLSLSTTNQPAAGFTPTSGFTPTNNVPPSGFGAAPGFQSSPPASFSASNSPTAAPSGAMNSAGAPLTYAGSNPILGWANRFHNYLFSTNPQPGQWQNWSGSDPAAPTMSTGFNSNGTPGFTPTSYSPPPTNNTTSATWQNRPEPRSLRTTDTYGPEPPVKIPDSALAGPINVASRQANNGGISAPPPSYPARPNAATPPAVPVTPASPVASRNLIDAARSLIASDPAWPEITSLPKR